MTPEVFMRFFNKVEFTGSCWLWTAIKTGTGYGQLKLDGRMQYAHRLSYEWLIGPIPEGLTIDHLCRVRHCVNPAHLEAVTLRENLLRGVSPVAINARKSHCPKGHEYAGENLYVRPDGGRGCKACLRAASRELYARRKAS